MSGGGGSSESGPVVIDDDWVVRKLAQIRRRSRSIDSATGAMPGVQHGRTATGHTERVPKATAAASADLVKSTRSAPPVRLGGMVTLQPLFQRTAHGVESLHTDNSDDRSLSPLLPPPAGRTPSHSSFPLPLDGNGHHGDQHQHDDHHDDHDQAGDETQRAAERAMSMMMPRTSPAEPEHVGNKARPIPDGGSGRENAASSSSEGAQEIDEDNDDGGDDDTVVTQVAGGVHDGHSGSPVTNGSEKTNAFGDEHFRRGGSKSGSVSVPTTTTADELGTPTQTETNGETTSASHQQQRRPGTMNHQREEQGGRVLHEVSPEERAMSLPTSSVLATDGSGDLRRRGIRWGSMGPVLGGGVAVGDGDGDDDGGGRGAVGGRGTVWSKRCVCAARASGTNCHYCDISKTWCPSLQTGFIPENAHCSETVCTAAVFRFGPLLQTTE